MKTEQRIQQECTMWFNNTYPSLRGLFFKIKNEGTNRITGAIDKATGLFPGVADSCLLIPNARPAFIEFKTDTGRQSPSQVKWEKTITDAGYMYFVVRSLENFQSICHKLL